MINTFGTVRLLHHWLERSANEHGDRLALICDGERITWSTLGRRVEALATVLREKGVERGERVAVYLENSIEAVVGIFATLSVGGVFMPINPMTKSEKLAYMLRDSGACALLAQGSLWKFSLDAIRNAPELRLCVVARQAADQAISAADGVSVVRWPDCETNPSTDLPSRPQFAPGGCIDQDLASIIYTSGSTGDPKGVMLSHLNMLSAGRSISDYLGINKGDVIFCALPLAFDYGLYQVLMAARKGACVVLERGFAFPVKALEVMKRETVTVFPGVPTMFAMLLALRNPEALKLPALRTVTNTAAALSEPQIARLRQLFSTAKLFLMYGLTECKRVTYLPPEMLDHRPTSVGRGMPNVEVWLTDETGSRLPFGSTGELVVRGQNVMRGYWNKPEASDQRLRKDRISGDMILHTGDIFRTDGEGWLYFVGRTDDIIKSRGEKVSPREVENAIHYLEGIADVAVVGVPDEVLGEAVKAFVVLREGVELTEREVVVHCRALLEGHLVPKHVSFVAVLPTTDTGKISKRILARDYQGGTHEDSIKLNQADTSQ